MNQSSDNTMDKVNEGSNAGLNQWCRHGRTVWPEGEVGTTVRLPVKPPAPTQPKRSREAVDVGAVHEDVDEDTLRVQDPFLYFSDDTRRMRHLRLLDVQPMGHDSSPEEERPATTTATRRTQRKSSISFEVHPSLLLDDDLHGDLGDIADLNEDALDELIRHEMGELARVGDEGGDRDLLDLIYALDESVPRQGATVMTQDPTSVIDIIIR